jgi:hypothetical protein
MSGAPWQSGWGLAKAVSGAFERQLQVTGFDPAGRERLLSGTLPEGFW